MTPRTENTIIVFTVAALLVIGGTIGYAISREPPTDPYWLSVADLLREPRPAPPPPPEPMGACCIGEGPDGVQACITTGKEKCLYRHSGAWLGPGTTCQGEPCR